ncbi:DsbE family thiol:disulfide interchange protein [Psychrosphaera aquimarina]|uniref:DsbE family thiol:disulfide interchange protein n=1 Tax=Psychrosphaera aquimarina TaxID=2044854 RepID=A0ABU3R4L5_9GAMM|nr:DsbE family thiol:disulfide interchange protein [Psychrosphaera aquimarina]MDU0114619.1 DsbE family thiol:disulfide interchange protein [Psychrosphaera aquimarina]
MTKKINFRFLPLVVFVLLLGFLLKGLFSDPNERDSALIGKSFPQFELPDLNSNNKIHTPETLLTEPVLVNVWGTWCLTCKYELPFLTKLANEYDVKIVGLYYDQNHAPEFGEYADIPTIRVEVKEMLARLGNPYQYNILDLDRSLSLDLGVTGAPESFLIDANGIVRMHHMGDVNERIWREKLAPVWNEISQ